MHAIAALAQAYGWRRVTAVCADNELIGSGAVSSLSDALMDVGSVISQTAELNKLMTMESRVFVVHMHSALGSKIFMEAKRLGMVNALLSY